MCSTGYGRGAGEIVCYDIAIARPRGWDWVPNAEITYW